MTLRITNGVTPYNKQVVANYTTPCTGPWWQCGWGANSVSATIGWWDATPAPQGDTTPPVISQTSASPTSNGATVTWSTNEVADSQVDYGTSTSYGSTTPLNGTLVNSHTLSLTGLIPATYYYRVRSRDAAGNLATQAAGPFTISAAGFTLTLTPANQETVQGSGTAHTVILNAQGGFTGSVTLNAPTVPPGATATFSRPSLLPGQSATLTLRTVNGTPLGQHPYVVSGTSATQSAISVSGTVRVTAKTAPLVVNSENTVHQPNTGNIWEPSSAVGNAWVTAWNILTDDASAVVDGRVRAWDGAWTNEKILIAPNGKALGDLYLEWDAGRKRYIFCAIDIQPGGLFPHPTNVWYGYSNEAVTEWTIVSSPVLSGLEGDWDFPSCGVDTSGRIGIGAVSKIDPFNLKFYVKVSGTDGTFSTPPTAIPTSLLAGQASKGALARLVAAGSEFHAFIPTLDLSYLPIQVNWHRGITNSQNGVIDWSSPAQLLYEFDPPLNHSPTDHCKTFPNDCKRIYYAGAHLDAHGTPGGHWAVVFSAGTKVGNTIRYNNAHICASDLSRGCGKVNPSVNDQFLAGVAVVDQPGTNLPVFWVSYLTYNVYNSQTYTGTIPLISQAIYFLPSQPGVGATTRTGIQPTYWLAHPGKCNIATGCYAAGDYVGISANPFVAASTPIIDKYLLRNGISQLFVQDPESPLSGQTFSIPWTAIPFGTVSRSATVVGPHISPGVNPALRRGPMTEKSPPRRP